MIEHLAWSQICVITLLILELKLDIENGLRGLGLELGPVLRPSLGCPLQVWLVSVDQANELVFHFGLARLTNIVILLPTMF